MAAFGPYPKSPHLAVAVSGGADSLALAMLADAWARRRGGSVTALTVDHGLRREAAAEARQVGRWLRAAGIAHKILRWSPPQAPKANIQMRAREARYGLMADWCRAHGIGDLLVAHHQEDQAETFLLRLARGSGLDGLAAMAAQSWRGELRLLRPLLDVPKAALIATLKRRKQPWIEDPSNANSAYARVRLRALMPALAAEGLTAERLAETAARLGQARAALALACDELLARAAETHDAGYARIDAAAFAAAPREVALRALARLLVAFGGQDYTPRYDRLRRLADEMFAGGAAARTLAGCRLLPEIGGGGADVRVLIVRETRDLAPPVAAGPGPVAWDGRFILTMTGARARRGLTLGALGEAGWREARAQGAELGLLPRALAPTLPTLRDKAGLLAVPHLAWSRPRGFARGAQAFGRFDDYVIAGPATKLRNAPGFRLV
ncbi:MAG: tRNA lysidine(34) synthetase TilS [Alphaproteobacteria bacterium]